MSDATREGKVRLTRRLVLQAAPMALVAVSGAANATLSIGGRTKMSQAEAHYQPTANGGLSCGQCVHINARSQCSLVAGVVTQFGWCKLFEARG